MIKLNLFRGATRRLISNLRRDEAGGITIFAILLLITMLILGGMAVDFMRYEAKRAELQSVSDRAVLAAANRREKMDPAALVIDYFEKAGYADAIVGTPAVKITGSTRSVSVRSEIDVNTFYLRLAGIDMLEAPAMSAAAEGVSLAEISLVLDISGSMRALVDVTLPAGTVMPDGTVLTTSKVVKKSRFVLLQEAATAFAQTVLAPNIDPDTGELWVGKDPVVSLNIIPYAGAVNPGPGMFSYLNAVRYPTYVDVPDGRSPTIDDDPYPQVSSCIELTGTDWTTSGLPSTGRAQIPHFMYFPYKNDMDFGWCPQDNSSIQYAVADPRDAATFLNAMRMHDGTGTHYGMKYGLALLDPSSQPAFDAMSALGVVPAEFSDRPLPWKEADVRKILVLMTDGAITEQYRPTFPIDVANLSESDGHINNDNTRRTEWSKQSANVTSFKALCNLAKDPSREVELFTVAVEVNSNLDKCASDPSMHFKTKASGLASVFANIAQRVAELRLTQ